MECLLFDKVYDKKTSQAEGFENPSFDFCLMKSFLTALKTKMSGHIPTLIMEYEKHVKLMELYQINCKKLLKYWIEIEYMVKAYDELNMCKMRISFSDNENLANNHRIRPHDLEKQFNSMNYSYQQYSKEFETKLARLKYIINFDKINEEMICPICTLEENQDVSYL